nr:hypothetical protein [Tanacetum cinerariifolium]
MLTSEAALSCELAVSSLNSNEIDFKISFDGSDDEDCMSWLVQEQTALGKDKSNPLTVGSLLKTIWSSIHHLLTDEVLTSLEQTATVHDEDDDVFTEATPIGRKVSVVDYEIVMINNKPMYKIIRADATHQLYISFITLLKNFDREDLEDLWRIVKDRFSTSTPTNFSDVYLLSILKTMFEKTDGQDAIWRNQQSEYGKALVKS